MEYEIKQLLFDDDDVSLTKLVDLQCAVYEGKHHFSINGFRNWYLKNPMGKVISFNAFYGDKLVAHYACIPYKMSIGGRVVLGLFDMATVTHPSHRGKGLFKTLAQTTYDYAKKNGYEFVIGVANANSFSGYMKYFPFTFVSRLEAKIGFGNNIVANGNKLYSVYWDKETLKWRSNCCKANYCNKGRCVVGRYNLVVQTYMGGFSERLLSEAAIQDKKWCDKPSLYVGLGAKFISPYIAVPKFIKHSPFNLIFLDLTNGTLPAITKDNVFFQLIDFDVA